MCRNTILWPFVTLGLIAILVIPMVAMQSPALANLIARGIVFGATVTVGLVWLMHGLLHPG